MIYKLRFHQTASLLINKTSETDTKEFTQEYQAEQKNRQLIENIDDFSHYYDVDSTIILDSSAVNARFDANFLMHEFKGRGFQIIENKIIKYLNADMFYTFKHYIAVPKDTYKNDTSAVITRLDKMHNRSLLLRRKPCAYDLYGQWYLH